MKIPTDDLWRRNGYIIVSKCWCCSPPKEDSYQLLFLKSETANRVWKSFLQPAEIIINMVQVHQVIRAWWSKPCCPKLKPLFQATPAIITLELWKRRNKMKHGGAVSEKRVIHEVNKTLFFLARSRYPRLTNIPVLWTDMIRYFERYKPYVVSRRVIWQLPNAGWFKCNSDGASKGNPSPSSYGYYTRDNVGDLIYAQSTDIGQTTNIVAEAKGILYGLLYCVDKQLHPLIMETDSLVMKKIIENEWECPWTIRAYVKKIKEIKDNYNVLFKHVFREGNAVADLLANLVFSSAGDSTFNSFHSLPPEAKTLINMDKSQIPNIRVRVAKGFPQH
ncbi:uncharacterized protein [Nicotiana tomentosiformis]|uniref:uncharacterized protein n=1 Tax=Nicotiana tomentosiformis TaxID=4098 RepID=UPI00388C7C12